MRKQIFGRIAFLLLAAIVLLTAGCSLGTIDVGSLQTDNQTVEQGAAESVSAEINLGAGRLEVDGSADALMDATFIYNVADWKPEVDYEVSGSQGTLTVEQPDSKDVIPVNAGEVRYEWELSFYDNVPLDMQINLGAGEGEIDLSDLILNSLNFQGGAGDVNIDLRGTSLTDLDVTLGAGSVSLDLSGDWQEDLAAAIQGGIGAVNVRLPRNVGVRIDAQGGLGTIDAPGFNKDGSVYTNDAYGQSDVTLSLEIESGVGEIRLSLAE